MGTTVGAIVVSYDINRYHTEVKNGMIQLGYRIRWNYDNQPSYELPNTTLWHHNKSSNQGVADLKAVCKQLGVVLEKAIAVKASEFVGI